MANIKSAKKRILVNETKAARNKAIKSKVKTAVKKVEAAVAAKDAETAKTALRAAIVEISKAGTKQQSERSAKQEAKVFTTKKLFPERFLVFPKL